MQRSPASLRGVALVATLAGVLVVLAVVPSAGAAPLTGLSASAPLQTTGAVETWTVTFTTDQAVPGSGDVRIVFPAGFETSSGAATACDITAPLTVVTETTSVVSSTEVLCTLGALDSILGGATVTLTLTNVKNPVTAGTTGTFTVQTRDAFDVLIDEHTTNTETIVASTLTGFSASAPLQTTGAVETWTVSFTTVNPVAGSGDIRIALPSGFQTSSGSATACDVTAPGTVTAEATTVVSAEVVCTLDAADSIAASTAVSLTLTNVKNPTTVQTTSAFTIQTRDATDAVHDAHTTNTESITAAALTGLGVAAPTQATGAVETWTVSFTTVNPVAGSGDIRIVLPSGFQTSSGSATVCDVTAPGTVTGESTTVVSATQVVCALDAGDSIAGSTAVTLTLTNVKNPTTVQTTGAFTIQTRDAADAVHDAHTTNTEGIVASTLTGVSASAPTQRTGAVETWTVAFTTVNPVAGSGDIRIVFPSGFQTSSGSATVCDITSPGTVAAETTTVVSATEVLCTLDAGDSIAASTAVSLTLTNVKNPTTVQTTAAFTVQTRDAADAVHDAHTTNTEGIVASSLTAVSAAGATNLAGSTTTWTVSFTTVNPVPASGDIRIVFPSGFQTSSGSATVCDVTTPGTVSGESTTVVSATEALCNLGAGDSVAAATPVTLTLTNVKNPSTSGTTAAFTLQTRDAANLVIDAYTTLTVSLSAGGGGGGGGYVPIAYSMPASSPTASSSTAGATGNWSFDVTLPAGLGGSVSFRVSFPAGFGLDADPACEITGDTTIPIWEVVRLNQTAVECEILWAPTLAPGSEVAVLVGPVTNPDTSGPAGSVRVELLDVAGRTLGESVVDVTLLAAASPDPVDPPADVVEPTDEEPDPSPSPTPPPTVEFVEVPGPGVGLAVAAALAALVAISRRRR